MIDLAFDHLSRLSTREKGLLAILLIVVLPITAYFGVVQPLSQARIVAAAEANESLDLRDWVFQRAQENLDTGQPIEVGAATNAPIGISGIEQSLISAGLRNSVTRLANRAEGAIDLGFDSVEFAALTAWLTRTAPEWGYVTESFSIEQGAKGGLVSAEFILRPQL